MKGWWKYAACVLFGAVLCGAVIGFLTRGAGPKLDAAIDGYRASLVSDYAERKARIADLEAVTRPGIAEVADLRSKLADATADAERSRQAEAERQRTEEQGAAAIAAGLASGYSESTGCTDLLEQAIAYVDGLLGQ